MTDYFVLAISCILVNNILLAQYLGNCPFLGTSKKMETATGMGMAVVFVLVLAGIITWITNTYILKPLNIEFLRTLSFILVIASLVQFVEMFLKKSIPAQLCGTGCLSYQHQRGVLLSPGNCFFIQLRRWIRPCTGAFCRVKGENQHRTGSKTPPGHFPGTCNRRTDRPFFLCFQGDGLD